MKKIIIKTIVFYRKWISPFKRASCVFTPTCSQYSKEAVEKYGVFKGLLLSVKRIARCHPWQKEFLDPLK